MSAAAPGLERSLEQAVDEPLAPHVGAGADVLDDPAAGRHLGEAAQVGREQRSDRRHALGTPREQLESVEQGLGERDLAELLRLERDQRRARLAAPISHLEQRMMTPRAHAPARELLEGAPAFARVREGEIPGPER